MRLFSTVRSSSAVLIAAFTAVAGFAGASKAATIVSDQYTIYSDHDLKPTEVAGTVPAANFNLGGGDLGNDSDSQTAKSVVQAGLVDSTGTPTLIGSTLSYDARFQANNTPNPDPNTRLLFGSYFTRRNNDTPPLTNLSLTLTGLTPTDNYDLYVYVSSPSYGFPTSSSITDGAQTFNFTTDANLTTLTPITATNADGNYVDFTGLTGSATTTVTVPIGFAGITGYQLVDNTASVPEPASMGLLSLGALAFLRRRRAK